MFTKLALLLVVTLGVAQGYISPVYNVANQRILDAPLDDGFTALFDETMANVRYQMRQANLTQLNIPGIDFEFSQTILGIVYHGEASIYDIAVKGIDTLHRTGVVDIVTEPNHDIIITVNAGMVDPELAAGMLVKFMNMGPTASISGSLNGVSVKVVIRAFIDIKDPNLVLLRMDDFQINHLGTLALKIQGLGILGFLVQIVGNILGNAIKGAIGQLLEGTVKDLINSALTSTKVAPSAQMMNILKMSKDLHQQPAIAPPQKFHLVL